MGTNKDATVSSTWKCIIGETVKTNKFILVALNTLILLPHLINHFSVYGLVAFAVISLGLLLMAWKGLESVPAVANIPLIVLADLCIYIGIHFIELKAMYMPDQLSAFISKANWLTIITTSIGVIISWIGIAKKRYYFTGIAGGLIIFSVILLCWSNCDISDFQISNSGVVLLILFGLASCFWTILVYIVELTTPQKVRSTIWIGVALLAAIISLLTIEIVYVQIHLSEWKKWIIEWPDTLFAWWRVILFVVVAIGAVYVLYVLDGKGGDNLSVDAYVLILVAEYVLLSRVLISYYFSHNWILPFLSAIGTIACMKNDYKGKRIFGLNSVSFLVIKLSVVAFTIILLHYGLWINILISLVFAIAFYVEAKKPRKPYYHTSHWAMIILCITVEAVAWIWQASYSAEKVLILALVFIMGLLALLIINIRKPGGKTASDKSRIAICLCIIALCLIGAPRFGTKTTSTIDYTTKTITVEVEAEGDENKVNKSYYYWMNGHGQTKSDEIVIRGDRLSIKAIDEVLIIITEDAHGVVSKKVIWFPFYLTKALE